MKKTFRLYIWDNLHSAHIEVAVAYTYSEEKARKILTDLSMGYGIADSLKAEPKSVEIKTNIRALQNTGFLVF